MSSASGGFAVRHRPHPTHRPSFRPPHCPVPTPEKNSAGAHVSHELLYTIERAVLCNNNCGTWTVQW